jgi:hypothetical protein
MKLINHPNELKKASLSQLWELHNKGNYYLLNSSKILSQIPLKERKAAYDNALEGYWKLSHQLDWIDKEIRDRKNIKRIHIPKRKKKGVDRYLKD